MEFIFPEYEEWTIEARNTARDLGFSDDKLVSRGNYGDLRDAIVEPLSLSPKRDYDQEERTAIVLANVRDASEEFLAGAAAFLLIMTRSPHLPTRLVSLELAMALQKLFPDGKVTGWLKGKLKKVESDFLKTADALAEDASRIVRTWLGATKGDKALNQWLLETQRR